MLTNLVSNAIKYGAAGEVRIAARAADGAFVVDGIGSGHWHCRAGEGEIFEPFERGASPKDYGGLGLGLYIARQIVDAHGGTIAVDSEPGKRIHVRTETAPGAGNSSRAEREEPAGPPSSTRSRQSRRPWRPRGGLRERTSRRGDGARERARD